MLALIRLGAVNVTELPASVPVATFCHTRVTMLEATFEPTSDHPDPDGLRLAVALFAEALSTRPSPATTALGTCTVHDVALRFLSDSPTKEIGGAIAVTLTVCEVDALRPFALLTVSVIG